MVGTDKVDPRALLQAELGLSLLMVNIDGEVTDEELVECSQLCDQRAEELGVELAAGEPQRMLRAEAARLEELVADLAAPDAYLEDLAARIPPEHRLAVLTRVCKVSFADADLAEGADDEEELLHKIGTHFGIDEEVVEQLIAEGWHQTAGRADVHEDEPTEETHHIVEYLTARGWFDAFKSLRDAGIVVEGGGAVALQYQVSNGHLLRLEHHPCDRSIHLHVTDADDVGIDLVLFPEDNIDGVLNMIVSLQETATVDSVRSMIPTLMVVSKVCMVLDGELVELTV